MTTNDTAPEGDRHTPGIRDVRIASGIALAVLPLLFMLTVIMIIDEALSSRGPSVLSDISGWLLLGSGVLGLAVLLVPARAASRPARIALLVGQCALMPVALALAAAA
ncbi:MAG TPA: hypothetical protein VGO89_10840 [Streptomyces sp.]|nr:hypothetical protein [Streptomyces sp.]